MVDRTDILTSIHGRQAGLNSDDELVVNGKVHLGLTEEQAANTNIKGVAGLTASGSFVDLYGLDSGNMTINELKKAFDAGRFYGDQVDRFASVFNRVNTTRIQASYIPSGGSASGKRRMLTYLPIKIGSGDRNTLRLILENQFFDVGTAGMPPVANSNAVAVTGMQIQKSTGGAIVQLTKGGSGTFTMAATDYHIRLDELSPAAFGVSKFTVGDTYYAQIEVEVDYNQYFVQREVNDAGTTQGYIFDPAINVWNKSNAGQPSAPSWSSGSFSTAFQVVGMGVIAVGKFISGDPLVLAGAGDSIFANGNGGSGTASYFMKLLIDNNIAGCQIGRVGGSTSSLTAGDRSTHLFQYSNSAIEEYNTNNDSETLSQLQIRSQTAWSAIRAAAIKSPRNNKYFIIRPYLLLKTDSSNVPNVNWNAGGKISQYNAWLESQKGLIDGPDIVVDPSIGPAGTIRLSTVGKDVPDSDYHKWGVGMNGDSSGTKVHPSYSAAPILAANVLPALPSLN